tara:strand:- start:41 stop:2953 length:2913 start_codon:yes stop_codon:yes gene_type:complete
MVADPFAVAAVDPQQAPVPQPGFFDGQMPDLAPGEEGFLPPDQPKLVPASEVVTEQLPAPVLIPEEPPVQTAGVLTQTLKQILKGKPQKPPRLKDVIDEPGTAGTVGPYTVAREATPEELADFASLTGRTSGKPSPTTADRLNGIPAAEFNLERIDGPDALKETIDKVSEIWKDAGHRAGRGTMTFEETKQLANEMGLDEVVERLLRRPEGSTMNAEQITASLQAIATSAQELNRLAAIAANSTDAADLLRFRQHMALHSALQTGMKGAQTEAARALSAFRIPRGVGPDVDAQALVDMMNDFGGEKSVRDMAKSYMALPTMAQRNKFSYSAWDKIKGTWFEIWINGLLSHPATHLVNMTGNTIFQGFQIMERGVAGLIGAARRAAGSERDVVALQEVMADLMGVVQGIGDGFRLAGEAWRTEAPVRDLVSKIESGKRRMITGANLAPDAPDWVARAIDYLGAGIRLPGRALMTEDEFFKAVAYRREINALAARNAAEMRRNGASIDDIAAATEDILAGKNVDINTQAEDFAQYATFTNPVQGDVGRLGVAIQGSVLGRMLLPFFKTPVNIFKAAAERSPYGFIKAINTAKGPARDMMIARASFGSAVMGYFAYEYIGGSITGSGPSDPTLRRQLESMGWQRWSFVSPKEGVENPRWIQAGHMMIRHPDDVDYVSYQRLEPASMLLAVSADIAERLRWPTATQGDAEEVIMSGIDTVFEYMKEQTVMRGVANIAEVLSLKKGKQRGAKVARLSQDLIGSQVPFSSALAGIERVMDPLIHSTIPDRNEPFGLRTLYAGLKRLDDRLPFTEVDGPLLLDRFGTPRLQKGASIRESLLPPFMADILGDDEKKIKADPVMLEVVKAGVPLHMPNRKIEGVPLTAEEYDQYVKWAANPPGQMSFYEALQDMFALKAYQDATIPDKQVLLQALDSDYKAIAKALLLDSEEHAERFENLRQQVQDHRAIIDAAGRQIQ